MVRRGFLAFLVLVFGLGACGDDSVSPEDVAGTYTLQSVDGEGLPVVLEQSTDFLLELTAGSATLDADLSCSLSFARRETDGGTVTTDTLMQACTYTVVDGFSLTRTADGVTLDGSIFGSTLTITDEAGLVLVFEM